MLPRGWPETLPPPSCPGPEGSGPQEAAQESGTTLQARGTKPEEGRDEPASHAGKKELRVASVFLEHRSHAELQTETCFSAVSTL